MTIAHLNDDQQFHSFALLRCRDHKAIDNQRMLDHFGVKTLIESIAKSSSERRADLVQKCTGIKRNSALKMSIESSIEMIETALNAGDTSAAEIFDEGDRGISTEEMVRFFPLDRVFDLWFYSGFITTETKDDKAFMADLYDFINQRQMFGPMTSLELVQKIGVQHFVSDKCPIEKRIKLLEKVLQYGDPALASSRPDASSTNMGKTKGFAASHLLETITPSDLVDFISLAHLAKPIEALATARGWMKKNALPEGALDSVVPPAQPKSETVETEPVTGASQEDAEVDALLQGDGKGDEEVVVVDGDEDVTVVAERPGLEVPKPPALRKDEKKRARA